MLPESARLVREYLPTRTKAYPSSDLAEEVEQLRQVLSQRRHLHDRAGRGMTRRFQIADQPRNNDAVAVFEHAESIEIACLPETAYDLVTDIRRTGEWSPICQSCWWLDEDGLREGAWFGGLNRADGHEWETVSQVAVARRGREFAWLIGGQYARWAYEFEPVSAGTRLTERWVFLPAGAAMFREKYGSDADQMIELRRTQALAGIPATLAAIKHIAEAEQQAR